MATKRSIYSTAGRTGGKRVSTQEEFERDVQTRLNGTTGAKGTIARVASARSENTQSQIVSEVNKRGGRNVKEAQMSHKQRTRAIKAALGLQDEG